MCSAPRGQHPPPPWTCRDPTSFAGRTARVRWPKILDDTVASVARAGLASDVAARLMSLRDEVVAGPLRGLVERAPDRDTWDAACAAHLGKPWTDAPWYFAESFFYRRVLECTGWFGDGPGRAVDPFLPAKRREEEDALPAARALARALQETSDGARTDPRELMVPRLLRASLWGNRADLSWDAGRRFGAGRDEELLADDTVRAMALLRGARRVAVLLDNAGLELLVDLQLAAALAPAEVVYFAKPHPFFVSDATVGDVARAATLLGLDAGTIMATTHPFLASSGFLRTGELPADLLDLLRSFDVAILKGDASYRRLVADAPWPPATPLVEAASFPVPFVALRTMKAEVIAGLAPGVAERAAALDADWMSSGRFGVIQVCG